MNPKKTIGLVLSGGGVKGMAHLGLLRAMEEQGIEADIISGASAGAIVGALYADGSSIDEILAFFEETPLFRFSYLSAAKPGLLDTSKYESSLKRLFPGDRFEALSKPLYVTTTNMESGQWEVHDKGPLISTLLASASMPPLFSPVEIDGCLHADGGVMNNFPVDPLLDQGLFILGSNVVPLEPSSPDELRTSMSLLNRAQALTWHSGIQPRLPLCDYLWEPAGINEINFMDFSRVREAYELGYEQALQQMPAIQEKLRREGAWQP